MEKLILAFKIILSESKCLLEPTARWNLRHSVQDSPAAVQSYNAEYIPNTVQIDLALLTQKASACITYFDNSSFLPFPRSYVGNRISMFMMNSYC